MFFKQVTMKENVESGIRIKAILIYLVFAIVCGFMIMFVYSMRESVNDRKKYIEHYNDIFALTNELVYNINEAQSEATLYISGKRNSNLKKFREKIEDVEIIVDSIIKISEENTNDTLLTQVSSLLKEKEKTILALNGQFSKQLAKDTVREKIQQEDPLPKIDSALVTGIVKDTIINKSSSKSFWGRVANVFSPKKTADTSVTIHTHISDTLKFTVEDKGEILSEINTFAEQISTDYANRLQAIERQVTKLIQTDREINTQLSVLLNSLSRRVLDSTFNEILESEASMRNNYNFSIYGGVLAFVLILLLILLIINDVNKGKIARKKLHRVMETRRQLLLSVSHDIKSPLASILGTVEMWKEEDVIPQKQARMLENSGQYIFALLNNLLEFSNMEQGELTISENNFNLRAFSVEIVAMFEPLATRKNLYLDYNFEISAESDIYGDELKMKQIVINILSNAVKYTKEGGICFSVKYSQDRVIFNIADTGVGIPANQIEELFQPFKRIEKNNAIASGSGLGMYVVKGLIEVLKGKIVVHSKENEGTYIEVILPVRQTSEKKMKFIPRKILIIDDDESILTVLQNMISHPNRQVHICKNPEEVGDKINPSDYDLIITDMEMGSITGIDILKITRKISNDIAVVIMTGQSDYNEKKADQAGFDFYLPKPISRMKLNRLLGIKEETQKKEFETLRELFAEDDEAFSEVVGIFITDTENNKKALQEALDSDDFSKAQRICHKMLPMFMQVGVSEGIEILRQMDMLRGRSEEDYPEWKNKISQLILHMEELIKRIR